MFIRFRSLVDQRHFPSVINEKVTLNHRPVRIQLRPSRAESVTAALRDTGEQSVDSGRKHKEQVRAPHADRSLARSHR
jgi:hypothetical protein